MTSFTNGDLYEGEWKKLENGEFCAHGWGTMTLQNGTMIIEGYFENGKSSGKCRVIEENGYYLGGMKDGLRHG